MTKLILSKREEKKHSCGGNGAVGCREAAGYQLSVSKQTNINREIILGLWEYRTSHRQADETLPTLQINVNSEPERTVRYWRELKVVA